MKACIAAALLLTTSALAQGPLPSFQLPKIEVPALPLLDRAKDAMPGAKPMDDAAKWFRQTTAKSAPALQRYVSNMPMVRPAETIDPKMVHTPRSDIDFKLLIKQPDVATRDHSAAKPKHPDSANSADSTR